MPFGRWAPAANITAGGVAIEGSIKDLIETLSKGDYIALLDRNDLEAPLRKVFLRREDDDDDRYTLHDERACGERGTGRACRPSVVVVVEEEDGAARRRVACALARASDCASLRFLLPIYN